MSASSLQRDGRDAYKRKDYEKAAQLFKRAIGRGDSTPQLLDNLAATQDKLADYPAALATAKKAIQAGRDDPTGYLRAGLVLKKMEKPSVALEIYAYGLKSIKHIGQGYEQLKKVHDELQQELAPKNSVDPLTMLPRELAIYILEYLSFRQRIGICRVSKGWLKFVRSEPSLWAHLDLSGAKAKVKSSFVSVAINTARSKLTAATLNKLFDFDKVLTALVRHCPLESLTLSATGLQGLNFVRLLEPAKTLRHLRVRNGTQIGSDVLVRLLGARGTSLESIECFVSQSLMLFDGPDTFDLPNMLSFDVRTEFAITDTSYTMNRLARTAPKLRRLAVKEGDGMVSLAFPVTFNLQPCAELEYLDLSFIKLNCLKTLQLPTTLRTLKLASVGRPNGADTFLSINSAEPTLRSMAELPQLLDLELDMPQLKWVDVDLQLSLAKPPQEDATQPLSTLRSLALRQVSMGEEKIGIPKRLHELTVLSLRDSIDLRDMHVECILDVLKKVIKLDLSGSSITGVSVKDIVKAGHVKELVVNNCREIGRDAIDWARTQGLKVEFRMTNLETGKKVRY